ncbi:hypothetical protein FRC11_001185, partial [Ceratobasidium sp. 423]
MSIPIISNKQYEVLQDICSVLLVLHHAQELLSAEKTPMLALALPMYEVLINALNDCIIESKFPELAYVINCTMCKLQLYLTKAHDLLVYTLTMAVNPTLKFSWVDWYSGAAKGQESQVTLKDAHLAPTHTATQAQGQGYACLLTVSKSISWALESSQNLPTSATSKPLELTLKVQSPQELTLIYMANVEVELLHWEQY